MAFFRSIPPIDFFNPRSVAVFVCILQGAIFAALLVYRWFKLRKSADLWLAFLLLLLNLSLITPFIGFASVYDNNQWLTYFPFSIAYSYGVCVWFYTLTLLEPKRRFALRDSLLFVPSIAYVSFRIFLFAHDLEWKSRYGEGWGPTVEAVVFVTEFAWNVTLLAIAIRLYRKYRSWLDDNFSDTEKMKFDWLRNFLYVFVAVTVLGAVFDFANSFVVRLSYIQYFYFEIILALVTYYLAVAGYLRSKTIEIDFHPSDITDAPDPDVKRAPIADDELARQKARLEEYFRDRRPYLDPQLTLTDLARGLGINTSALSFVINNGFGKNFNDLVNGYRIEEVKRRLAERTGDSTLAIAFDSGFNSKATFNRAFRKFTGSSPKEYLAGKPGE